MMILVKMRCLSFFLFYCTCAFFVSGQTNSQNPQVFKDPRDGQEYKTMQIGAQFWMIENMKYKTDSGSVCYGNYSSNCQRLGRLYNYQAATKVCPAGWHLPEMIEWEELFSYVNNNSKPLKLISPGVSADNRSGFSAVMAGSMNLTGTFSKAGEMAMFWSSGKNENGWMKYVGLKKSDDAIFTFINDGTSFLSVRCIKDY